LFWFVFFEALPASGKYSLKPVSRGWFDRISDCLAKQASGFFASQALLCSLAFALFFASLHLRCSHAQQG
jgi:hypothetical protein